MNGYQFGHYIPGAYTSCAPQGPSCGAQPMPSLVLPPARVCGAVYAQPALAAPVCAWPSAPPVIPAYPPRSCTAPPIALPVYAPPPCNPAPAATPSFPEASASSRETLGITSAPTTRAALAQELNEVEIRETEAGGLRLTFTSTDADFRLGFSREDGSYSEGGAFNKARGVSPEGRAYQTNSVKLDGYYKVALQHRGDGTIEYTVTVEPSVVKLRLDIGDKSMLLEPRELIAVPSLK